MLFAINTRTFRGLSFSLSLNSCNRHRLINRIKSDKSKHFYMKYTNQETMYSFPEPKGQIRLPLGQYR